VTEALVWMQWAVGASLVLLAAITFSDWTRHGGRSRQYLALTVGLLGLVAVLGQVSTVTTSARFTLTGVELVIFMGSAFSLVLFRHSVIPGRRWIPWLLGLLTLALTAAAIAVNLVFGVPAPSTASSAADFGPALWTDIGLVLVWCLLVGLSIAQLWLASRDLPRVQKARLRALSLGFTGIIVALIGDVAAAGATQSVRFQLVIESIVVVSVSMLGVAFRPPSWLRRLWREGEEVQFRGALNDLLLYSPDVVTLCQRALEWPSRLLGARAAIIALNGQVIAADGLDPEAASRLHNELEPFRESGRRSLVSSAGPTAVAPLRSRAGEGYIAVVGGSFTPLFGTEEVLRLDQYRVSITLALDRVHLVEGVRRNAELLDLAYNPILTWDFGTRAIQYWNRAASDLYGFSEEEAVGTDPQLLIDTQLPDPLEGILQTLEADGHWEGEMVQRTKDGRALRISARWALQRDMAGRPSSVLEINRDISAEKEVAEQLRRARDTAEQASRAKSEYLSRMSHELRTPLAAMLGFSDLLEMREPRDDQLRAIDAIQRAGSHLLSLVNDVLDIARIESGRESLSLAPVAVHALLEECARLVSHAAIERDIELNVDVTEGAEQFHVRADRQRLVQVVLNLLSNAIKYCGGGSHVELTATVIDGDVEIAVRDDGPGLSDDEQARLFHPFERLGAERSQVQGTGLGLSLCLQLTAAMGGTIGVRSVKGAGATFWVRLRLATGGDEESVVAAAVTGLLRDAEPDKTVLYVEDNLATVGLVESIFALRPSVRLITAMQGSLAVDLAREHRPDLVILDLHLPDLNGDEVMHRLQDDPRTSEIPVVIYSADATQKQVARLLGEGAVAYLTKPARVTEFLGMLDRILADTSSKVRA
jgi:PAS domain S-box-containing protein